MTVVILLVYVTPLIRDVNDLGKTKVKEILSIVQIPTSEQAS
jgi:hypothetical protein